MLLPRLIDLRPARRPGGLRGAPFPAELAVGAAVLVWLADGQSLAMTAAADSDPTPGVAWELIDWWLPL